MEHRLRKGEHVADVDIIHVDRRIIFQTAVIDRDRYAGEDRLHAFLGNGEQNLIPTFLGEGLGRTPGAIVTFVGFQRDSASPFNLIGIVDPDGEVQIQLLVPQLGGVRGSEGGRQPGFRVLTVVLE